MNALQLSEPAQAVVMEELAKFKARLKWREDDMRLAAAEAILEGDDEKASSLFPPIRELGALSRDLEQRLIITERLTPSFAPPLPSLSTPSKVAIAMRVTYGLRAFLSGTKIEEYNDASTFASVIHAIGCPAVAELHLTLNFCPLVSRQHQRPPFGGYNSSMHVKQRGEWFIVTHSNTARKAALLKKIAKKLKLDLVVETSWHRMN